MPVTGPYFISVIFWAGDPFESIAETEFIAPFAFEPVQQLKSEETKNQQ